MGPKVIAWAVFGLPHVHDASDLIRREVEISEWVRTKACEYELFDDEAIEFHKHLRLLEPYEFDPNPPKPRRWPPQPRTPSCAAAARVRRPARPERSD